MRLLICSFHHQFVETTEYSFGSDWCGSTLPVTAMSSVYPTFSYTVLGLNAKFLVSQGWTQTFLYFDLVLSCHSDCCFFRASVRLARSLLEHLNFT